MCLVDENSIIRLGVLPINECISSDLFRNCINEDFIFEDEIIKLPLSGASAFKKQTSCYVCGLEAKFCAFEKKSPEQEHWDKVVYGLDADNNEIKFSARACKIRQKRVSVPICNDCKVAFFNKQINVKERHEVKLEYLKKNINMIRSGTYSIEEVLPLLSTSEKINFHGDCISLDSKRYRIFYHKGIVCAKCGLEASFFAKERYEGNISYHLNLYGIDKVGDEVLFTRDHVLPRALGGSDHIDNQVTMCLVCNNKKGIYVSNEEIEHLKEHNATVKNNDRLLSVLEEISRSKPDHEEQYKRILKKHNKNEKF